MKAKTPEQLRKSEEQYDRYNLYLHKQTMDYLKQRAAKADTSLSKLVNEAISAYATLIKDKKND